MTVLRYVLVSVAMCCGLISTLGQSQPLQLYPIPVHGKWGYIDRNGSVRIPRRFDSASAFREGLAVVQVDAKCGFIDHSGKIRNLAAVRHKNDLSRRTSIF